VLRRISGLLAARLTGSALQAVLIFSLARKLGVEHFGQFSLAVAIGALLGTLTGLGSVNQALKLTASSEDRGEARSLLRLRFVTAIVVCGFSGLLAARLGFSVPATLAITGWILTELVVDVAQAILLGQQMHGRGNTVIVSRRLFPLVGFGIGALVGHSWLGLALGCACGLGLTLSLAYPIVRDVRGVPGVIRRSMHYWGSTVMVGVQNSDVALVGTLTSSSVVLGRYSVASRLSSPLNIFTQAVVGILTPKMAREEPCQRVATYRTARRYCILYGVALLVVSPVLGEALVFVLGQSYEGAQIFVVGITVSVGISALAQLNAAYLYASNNADTLARARYWSVPMGMALVAMAALSPWVWCLAFAPVALQLVQWGATQRAVLAGQNAGPPTRGQ
jgi:O-antigen/teichoic acid export membrane protein